MNQSNQPAVKSQHDDPRIHWTVDKEQSVGFETKEKLLLQAIGQEPDRMELQRELALLHYHVGNHEAVANLCEKQVDNSSMIHIAGSSAMAQGNLDRAIMLLRKACAHNHFPARADLAEALDQSGQHDEAIEICHDLLSYNASDRLALRIIGNGMLRAGDGVSLLGLCDQYAGQSGQKVLLDVFRTAAKVILGEIDHSQLEEMFTDNVAIASVTPDGWDMKETRKALITELEQHPNRMGVAYRQSTRGGTRVSDLLPHPSPCISALADEFRSHVEHYLEAHPTCLGIQDAGNTSCELKLKMWGVILKKGGFQEWHMHPDALISGVYYVTAPEIGNADEDNAGWLEFGAANNIHDSSRHRTWPVQPKESSLVIFPSSYVHRTRPHSGQSPRISIAFDAVPVS